MSNSKSYIVLTGATGFLGGFLLAALLKNGHQIIVLGRAKKEISLANRLTKILQWFDIFAIHNKQLLSFEVDFEKNKLGLNDDEYNFISNFAYKIIHCASDTSFAERNKVQVMATNVANLPNILALAKDAKVEHLYYLSTAYAAGLVDGICKEIPIENSKFTNVYEESKALAENFIIDFCKQNNLEFSILRPSIVFGDSKTGKALKFNGLYYPVKSLLYTRDIFKKAIISGKKNHEQWGIGLDNDVLNLPLNIYLAKYGSLNLVSVDYFIDTVMRIIRSPNAHGIYHICSDNPTDLLTLAKYSERFLNIRGIKIIYNDAKKITSENPVEELFTKFIEPYIPYLSDQRIFDTSRTRQIIPDLPSPVFTYEIFERCMNYAIANDWKI